MQYTHDGLTLWYGSEDAPAPEGIVDPDESLSVVAGVSPANPSNTVSLLYRVGKGLERTVRASLLGTEHGAGQQQYFKASFPRIPAGSKVAYTVICESCGRRVPDPGSGIGLNRQFEVSNAPAPPPKPVVTPSPNLSKGRLPVRLEYLCHFTVHLGGGPPEIIGETPEGIKVNWYISRGEFAGPKLNGKVRHQGGDWMTIRRDGIGIIGVRATLETLDGALIYVDYSGVSEWGENGYQNFLIKKWPSALLTRSVPRLFTSHPNYLWVNRLQCIGIGQVFMAELIAEYDMYGLV